MQSMRVYTDWSTEWLDIMFTGIEWTGPSLFELRREVG